MTTPTFSDGQEPGLGLTLVQDDNAGLDPDDDPAGGAMPGFDPDAPFGRFANGKPRKSPAGSRSSKGKRPGQKRTPAPPRKTTTASRKQAGPDYTAASMSLISMLQMGTGVLGTVLRNDAFRADTATLVVMGPQLAQISGQLAQEEVRWGQMLDRIATTGKWSAPAVAAFGLVVQLGVNHGLVPAGVMGTKPPQQVMDEAEQILAAQQAVMAEQMTQAYAAAAA